MNEWRVEWIVYRLCHSFLLYCSVRSSSSVHQFVLRSSRVCEFLLRFRNAILDAKTGIFLIILLKFCFLIVFVHPNAKMIPFKKVKMEEIDSSGSENRSANTQTKSRWEGSPKLSIIYRQLRVKTKKLFGISVPHLSSKSAIRDFSRSKSWSKTACFSWKNSNYVYLLHLHEENTVKERFFSASAVPESVLV